VKRLLSSLKTRAPNEKGMTLIDVSIALVVIALIAYPLVKEYDRSVMRQKNAQTSDAVLRAESAVQLFFFNNGRYPCPANPSLGRDNANYGVSAYGLSEVDGTISTCLDSDGNPLEEDEDIIQGMVPFKTLKLEEKSAYDVWGNRLEYAVSVSMARSSFNEEEYKKTNPDDGSPAHPNMQPYISLTAFSDADHSGTINTPVIHYLIFSYGLDGAGAYGYEGGVPVAACPDDSVLEAENCDGDGEFFLADRSEVEGNNYYDDVMIGRGKDDFPGIFKGLPNDAMRWTPENPNTGQVRDKSYKVGLGFEDVEDIQHALDVNGDIHIGEDGAVQTGSLCKEDESDCFAPIVLAGSKTDEDGQQVGYIWCETGIGFASAIANSDASCDAASVNYFSVVLAQRKVCSSSTPYMTGIQSGVIQCAASPY
jgi:Tfp pilus assembly protein PilE